MSWPTMSGTVVMSRLMERRPGEIHGVRGAFYPEIRYEYLIGGQSFTGTRIKFRLHHSVQRDEEVLSIIHRYPVSTSVKVYCKPGQPRRSTLVPGGDGGADALFVAALAVVAIGVYLTVQAWKVAGS